MGILRSLSRLRADFITPIDLTVTDIQPGQMEKLLMKKSRLKGGKMEKTSRSLVEATSAIRNENEFLLVDFPDIRK